MFRKTATLGTLLLVFGLGIGLVVADSAPRGPWVSGDGTAPALRIVEASYEVEVLGTLARGTLVQRFVNESGEILTVSYRTNGLPGLLTKSIAIEVDGEAVPTDGVGDPPERVRKPASRDTARTARPSGPQAEIKPSEVVAVRLGFESLLGITDGTFHLRLPAPPAHRFEASR